MKTIDDWYPQFNDSPCGFPLADLIKAVQDDALEAAIAACEEVMKANLDAQEEPLEREELDQAQGAWDGAHDCAVLIRRLKDDPTRER